MTTLVQQLLVCIVVVGATSYAALKLMPAAWRKALAVRIASLAIRSGFSEDDARRVEAKLSTGGACGSCDSCKACATPKVDDATFRHIPIRRA